jgi:hypothetical protein
MPDYRVFGALHEDTDKGWVWVLLDDKLFASRTTIKISRRDNRRKRSVYCEYRNIDDNFVKQYDRNDDTTCMYFTDKNQARQHCPVVNLASPRMSGPPNVALWFAFYSFCRVTAGDSGDGSRHQGARPERTRTAGGRERYEP